MTDSEKRKELKNQAALQLFVRGMSEGKTAIETSTETQALHASEVEKTIRIANAAIQYAEIFMETLER